jgi:signal transduction histidine kinase
MAVSYVLVTAAAVLVVEVIMLAVIVPRLLSGTEDAAQAQSWAGADAKTLSVVAAKVLASMPGLNDDDVRNAVAKEGHQLTRIGDQTGPKNLAGKLDARDPKLIMEVLVAPDGTVVPASATAAYPIGGRLPVKRSGSLSGSGVIKQDRQPIAWALSPVLAPASGSTRVIAAVYVQTPVSAVSPQVMDAVRPFLVPGLVVIGLIVPVGVLFGLLSTGRVIRRIRRLAEVTTTMADGDFRPRIPVSGGDEIGRLEDGFNRMAGRLEEAVQAERRTAGADARRAERARISRELHDSISQDLFSLSLLAGGMRKALPAGSELRPQAEAMERTAGRTMREMQAMLLELRPVALEDAGLVPALEELCRAYETRLGIQVRTDFVLIHLDPAIEHAVLRVTQEALSNAVKHGEPEIIELCLASADGHVVVEVHDDGRGFDPARAAGRHGMGLVLMRERVAELGGVLDVVSRPAAGTTVRVRLPERAP